MFPERHARNAVDSSPVSATRAVNRVEGESSFLDHSLEGGLKSGLVLIEPTLNEGDDESVIKMTADLPTSLLRRFAGEAEQQLVLLLRVPAPLAGLPVRFNVSMVKRWLHRV